MKIHINKSDLFKGVQTVQSALSPRTTLPILLNFLIETEASKVKLVSTDLQMGMKHYIQAEIESDGSITIPAKKFSDIINSLQDGEIDLVVDEGGKVQIKSGRSRFNIIGAPKSEYPILPELQKEKAFGIPSKTLEEMLRKTIFAASTDETRFALNGVFWVAGAGNLDLVATDGRRLAMIRRKCAPDNKEFRVIVPTKILIELLRLLNAHEKDADEVLVSVTENQIAFLYKSTTLLSRLVEGSFPNYEQVIPTKKDIKIPLETEQFAAITKRASLCAVDRGGIVKYTLKKGVLHVYASSQNLEFDDEISVEYTGSEFVIAFNPQFILEGLKNMDADKVTLNLTTPTSPALIEADGDPEYQYVVMPMRA